MTPTRQEWRGLEIGPIIVDRHAAFGWVVHRHLMPVGSKMKFIAAREVQRASAPNIALYVAGRGEVSRDNGTAAPDRLPGLFTPESTPQPAGTSTVCAVEPLEFWCFNWHANRGALPAVQALRLADGEAFTPNAGQRVLVCRGALGAHEMGPFVANGSALQADGQVYGFLIGADRG